MYAARRIACAIGGCAFGPGTLVAGLAYLRQEAAGDANSIVDERNIYSVFAGYSGQFGRHTLHASVRNDDNSQHGSQTTGAIGYALQITPAFRTRASRMDAYAVVNFVAGYALGRGWSVDLRWNNLLNTDYELSQAYSTPGSKVFVSVRYLLR